MARHNRKHCYNVIFRYPKRLGDVKFIDAHGHTGEEAKQSVISDPSWEAAKTISERGQPLRIVAKRHPYYHGWFETLD